MQLGTTGCPMCRCAISVTPPQRARADNGRFYAASGLPFVMGTTGGDREALLRDARAAGVSAVVAPQMGKQARQAASVTCIHCSRRSHAQKKVHKRNHMTSMKARQAAVEGGAPIARPRPSAHALDNGQPLWACEAPSSTKQDRIARRQQ